MPIEVREARDEDRSAIFDLLVDAFQRKDEARLVDALREGGDLAISLVAQDSEIAGYIGFARLKSPARALALAPVAVGAARRGGGIGSALIREGIDRARRTDCGFVFVMGDPGYYGRFGFSAEVASAFACPYAGPHFMGLRLRDLRMEPAPVVYPAAFDHLT